MMRLVIAVLGDYSIVNGLGDVVEYIECHLWRYVEKIHGSDGFANLSGGQWFYEPVSQPR